MSGKIEKTDCVTVDEAMKNAQLSRGTFYSYLNYLGIQRHKFPFDRRAYILKSDVQRVIDFKESNRA